MRFVLREAVGRFLACCVAPWIVVAGAAAEPVQLTVHGQARTFLLERPSGRNPHPTIIVLHRGSGTAEEELNLSALAQHGPQQGFAVVFPQARGGYWNFFPPGKESDQYKRFLQGHGGVPDDAAFLETIVADLVRNGISDPKRVYLAGRSLGGVMVLRLVCVDAERFAAVAVLTSAMPDLIGSDCEPARPMPVLIVNGTEDRVLPYKGMRTLRGNVFWSTERLVAFFRHLNDCAEPDQPSFVQRQQAPDIAIASSTRCRGGPVVLYSLVGGGHDIPAPLDESQVLLNFFHDKAR
jgi:polyhydroxybutyrate depolymerase